jgi:DNA-binding HxlR family transcriptional regulator
MATESTTHKSSIKKQTAKAAGKAKDTRTANSRIEGAAKKSPGAQGAIQQAAGAIHSGADDDIKSAMKSISSKPSTGSKPGPLPVCPVETTLSLIGNKWQVLILRDLLEGTKRFKELQRSVGNISQKVLTSNLRIMEEQGLVHREVYAEVPPRVEYSLTDLGKTLRPVLEAMSMWGDYYKKFIALKSSGA